MSWVFGESGEQQVMVDCKNMVLAWLASKLGPKAANTMLRNLISCRVNKGTDYDTSGTEFRLKCVYFLNLSMRCKFANMVSRMENINLKINTQKNHMPQLEEACCSACNDAI